MSAQGVVIQSIEVATKLKTSETAENIGKHIKSSDIILKTTENPSLIF
jgi:hypothetical protein